MWDHFLIKVLSETSQYELRINGGRIHFIYDTEMMCDSILATWILAGSGKGTQSDNIFNRCCFDGFDSCRNQRQHRDCRD